MKLSGAEDLLKHLDESTEIRGVVTHSYCSKPKFSAGILRKPDKCEIRFAGDLYLKTGDAIVARGQWVNDPKFGKQFRIESVDVDGNMDAAGLANWLSVHPDAVGIGPVRAKRVAEAFGNNFDAALRDRPEKIAEVAGVPLENIRKLAASWASRAGYNAVATQLAAIGLTKHQIEKLIEACGSTVVQALKDDPYSVLGKVPGFGFKRIDDIARKNYGMPKDSERRIDAGIIHCLRQALDDGSTCLARPDLCGAAEKALFLDGLDAEDVICERIDDLARSGRIIGPESDGAGDMSITFLSGPAHYALPWVHAQETFVAEFVKTGSQPNPCELAGLSEIIQDDCLFEIYHALDDSQRAAALLAFHNRIAVMSGGAGCGKTTTIRAIAAIYQHLGKTVALCCPTGKAARRLSQVTGLPAQTIHRLLEYSPIFEEFSRNEENPIDADVVIVDEVSMVDIPLAFSLFRAIGPRTAVLLVGDHHQLPPVGPGALLRDCIQKELVPTEILSHCHRQAGVLKHNCSLILTGEVPNGKWEGEPAPWYMDARHSSDDPSTILTVIEKLWLEIIPKWGYDKLLDCQILSGMHRGTVGTKSINILLQRLHQKSLGVTVAEPEKDKPPRLYVGDRAICVRNDYGLGVMNGMQGIVRSCKPLVVEFEGREVEIPTEKKVTIQLAFCITPHKAQGSEWPCVVVICAKEQFVMHSRNWLYTGVTRAQKTCVLLGDLWSIERAARHVKPNQRQTILSLAI